MGAFRSVIRHNGPFAGLQWFFWSGFGLLFAFLPAYYEEIGFSSIEVGLVMALVSAANIAGQPILGTIADRIGSAGRVLSVSIVASIILALVMYATPVNVLVVAVLSSIVSFTAQTLPPIIDGWTMTIKRRRPEIDYGITRAMGSVGFSVTVALAGRAFDRWTIALMFPGAAAMFAGAIVFVLWGRRYETALPVAEESTGGPGGNPEDPPRVGAADGRGRRGSVRAFFAPQTVALLVIGLLTFTAFRPVQVFLPGYIRLLGGTNRHIGYGLAVMAVSEVPVMILFSRLLKRVRDIDIVMVALVFFFLRILVHVFAPGPGFVIAVQVLQGLSFGLYLPASVHLLDRLAPAGTSTFAQTAGSVATFGLGSVFGSAVGGYLVDGFGMVGMYAIMSVLMAVTAVAYAVLFLRPGWIRKQ